MIRYLTAGESHGLGLTVIIEGFPSGVFLDTPFLQGFLKTRQYFVGRSRRSLWEKNAFHVLSGIAHEKTTGAPLTFFIENDPQSQKIPLTQESKWIPRPGHADLVGLMKYNHENIQTVWERSSGRETAARTLCGALCLSFLKSFGIQSLSHVTNIGGIDARNEISFEEIEQRIENSSLLCADPIKETLMKEKIEAAFQEKTSVGGVFEVRVKGAPLGLGSYVHWNRKLDAEISRALLSIQGIKGVEFGLGFDYAKTPGHLAHDEITGTFPKNIQRTTNRAGGIEGGMTNGEEIIARAVVKPPSTLLKPLSSLNIKTNEKAPSLVTRTDVCFVPSCAIVGQAVTGIAITNAFLEKFGGDSLEEIKNHYDTHIQ